MLLCVLYMATVAHGACMCIMSVYVHHSTESQASSTAVRVLNEVDEATAFLWKPLLLEAT